MNLPSAHDRLRDSGFGWHTKERFLSVKGQKALQEDKNPDTLLLVCLGRYVDQDQQLPHSYPCGEQGYIPLCQIQLTLPLRDRCH